LRGGAGVDSVGEHARLSKNLLSGGKGGVAAPKLFIETENFAPRICHAAPGSSAAWGGSPPQHPRSAAGCSAIFTT